MPTHDTNPGKRRRAPESRRDDIMRAAVALFAEHGYARATTKAIAHAAGVSEGTIYNYFATKEELLFAFLEEMVVAPLTVIVTDISKADDETLIRALIHDRLSRLEGQRDLVKVVFGEALFNKAFAAEFATKILQPASRVLEGYLARRMADGAFRPLNPTVAVRALIGHIFTYFLLWNILLDSRDTGLSTAELADTLATLFLHGIACPPTPREESTP